MEVGRGGLSEEVVVEQAQEGGVGDGRAREEDSGAQFGVEGSPVRRLAGEVLGGGGVAAPDHHMLTRLRRWKRGR